MLNWMNRSTSSGAQGRASKIALWVKKVAKSGQSVTDYFRTHKVPFSRMQFYRYKARLGAEGISGLNDGRSQGNYRKLTPEAEGFLRGAHMQNPALSLTAMRQLLQEELGIDVGLPTVSGFFKRAGEAIVWPRPSEPERRTTQAGGFEIVASLALLLGWAEHTGEIIRHAVSDFQSTAAYQRQRVSKDRKGRQDGRFTSAYNLRSDVRKQRFASVEEKRERKNYSRMVLFQVSPAIIGRKCLGILALPLTALNGGIRSANSALGNTLEHFCGFNYQHHTLDKFLRDLKYLGLAEHLLRAQVGYWQKIWRELGEKSELPFLCYYVDGNTKTLWSQKRVKKNKVTMLGRVMGCLEQVFVHDAFGHPVYLETYAGRGEMGAYVLKLMEKIEDSLEGPGPTLTVTWVIVMDAGSNGVATLRAFAEQEQYHYITALDDNQWNPNKVRVLGRAKRYEYDKATLRDCQIELEDSRRKGYLIVVRAVRIDWDYGKTTVLITSLPQETVGPSLVVKAYFSRWPHEEQQFRAMKSFACLHRVAGYGKKKLPDEKAREKQKKFKEQIKKVKQKLAAPLEAIAGLEEQLVRALDKQRQIHSRCAIVKGRRIVNKANQVKLESLAREIAQCRKQIRSVETECSQDLKRLRKSEKQWLGLQGKDFLYKIDVELDQIMTFFRISLVNLCCWFLLECMGKTLMSLSKLLHTILMLPAEVELTNEVRRVKLRRNLKDKGTMAKLEPALQKLNALGIKHPDRRRIEFSLL
jgi:transposase